MQFNAEGLALIKKFEQCRLHAYPDPATGGAPWTVGWGSTGPDVSKNTVVTQEWADRRLDSHLQDLVYSLKDKIKVPLTDNEFSAVVSLVYNIGVGNFQKSTMLKMINMFDLSAVANEFLKWDHANGKIMPGLTARREAERKLFLS